MLRTAAGRVGFGRDMGATRALAGDDSGRAMEATATAMAEADRLITDPLRKYKFWLKVRLNRSNSLGVTRACCPVLGGHPSGMQGTLAHCMHLSACTQAGGASWAFVMYTVGRHWHWKLRCVKFGCHQVPVRSRRCCSCAGYARGRGCDARVPRHNGRAAGRHAQAAPGRVQHCCAPARHQGP